MPSTEASALRLSLYLDSKEFKIASPVISTNCPVLDSRGSCITISTKSKIFLHHLDIV